MGPTRRTLETEQHARIHGDDHLARVALRMVSVIA